MKPSKPLNLSDLITLEGLVKPGEKEVTMELGVQAEKAKHLNEGLTGLAGSLEDSKDLNAGKLADLIDVTKMALSRACPPEVKEISEALERDYFQNQKALHYFGLLKENAGQFYYEADYDGSLEKIPAKNFIGERFDMPSLEECYKCITPAQVKLYKEMEKAGKEPKLRLIPIGYKTDKLGVAIDSRMEGTGAGEIAILKNKTFINTFIKDHEMIYEPDDIEAFDIDREVKIMGGKPMSQQIQENQGWKIEIIENVQPLDADADKTLHPATKDPETGIMQEYTLAKKQELYFRDAKSKGLAGLGYKSYLAAQMCNLIMEEPLPFDRFKWNILTESYFTDQYKVPSATWDVERVYLSFRNSDFRHDNFRFRRSVSVLRRKT